MLRDAKQWNRGILREEKSEGKWVDFSMHIISLCRTIQKTHVEDILKVTTPSYLGNANYHFADVVWSSREPPGSILIYPHRHPSLRLSRFYFRRAKPLELTHTTTRALEQWVRSFVLHPSSCFIDMCFLVLEVSIRCPDGWSQLAVASEELSVPPFH